MIISYSLFPTRMFSKAQKMMLGIAIGDAYGAGYEFRFPNLSDYQNIPFEKYIKSAYPDSPDHRNHFPGMYTDDTQMSIAVAELLTSDEEFTRENLAEKFVHCYKRHRINGYARKFQAFLDSVDSGQEFLEKIVPDSMRNGAAMRSVPLGMVKDLETVVGYAKINASLTHNTPKGIASSVAVALLSHLSYYGNRSSEETIRTDVESIVSPIVRGVDPETADYLISVARMKYFNPRLLFGEKHEHKGVPCDGMRTAGAVVYILSNFNLPKDILKESVKLGGDVDSVASISLGIGLMNEYMCNLPGFLYKGLTNYLYGREYLCCLGTQLEHKLDKSSKNNL